MFVMISLGNLFNHTVKRFYRPYGGVLLTFCDAALRSNFEVLDWVISCEEDVLESMEQFVDIT